MKTNESQWHEEDFPEGWFDMTPETMDELEQHDLAQLKKKEGK
jgi:hypothetical protein